jgi:hypothetical protein
MLATDNRKYIKDVHFKTADEFLRSISYGGRYYRKFGRNFIFRGHSSDTYELLPTALRRYMYEEVYPNSYNDKQHVLTALSEYAQIESEAHLLFDFYKMCDESQLYVPEETRFRESFLLPIDFKIAFMPEWWIAKEYQELAALAQHHGVPTRLLDWTSNINVAIYFASSSVIRKKATPDKKTLPEWSKEMRSRFVSVWESSKTNGSREEEQNMELWALDRSVLFADIKNIIPLEIVRPRYFGNDNLSAQKGLFTCWLVKKPLNKNKNGQTIPDLSILTNRVSLDKQIADFLEEHKVKKKTYIYHFTIPQNTAIELYEYAKQNHCDASSMFPGYGGVARCIEEDGYVKYLKLKSGKRQE